MPAQYNSLYVDFSLPALAVLTLNRPEAANALNQAMAEEISSFFSGMSPEIRAVIITGAGTRAFCAGADLKERRGMSQQQWHEQHHAFEKAAESIRNCHVPVIAAVNGAAFGGGLELALQADFIYAARSAKFALTETTLGIIPGLGGTQTLARAIGMGKAKELIFTGRPFSAEEAERYGMLAKLCEDGDLMTDARATAEVIAANAPQAVARAKKAMGEGSALMLEAALACELKYYNSLLGSEDRHEGINAYNEKRRPKFSGK